MFGGADGQRPGDTWAFDGVLNTWEKVSNEDHMGISAPTPRARHAMVYDTALGKTILFGGAPDGNPLGDTWAFDGNTNTWTKLLVEDEKGLSAPSPRWGHAIAYDAFSGKIILFGCADGPRPRVASASVGVLNPP